VCFQRGGGQRGVEQGVSVSRCPGVVPMRRSAFFSLFAAIMACAADTSAPGTNQVEANQDTGSTALSSFGSKVFVTPPRLAEAEAPRVLIHCPQNAGCTAFALYLCELLDAACRPDTDCNEVVEWRVPRGVAYVHKATLSGHGEPDSPNPQLNLALTPALTLTLTVANPNFNPNPNPDPDPGQVSRTTRKSRVTSTSRIASCSSATRCRTTFRWLASGGAMNVVALRASGARRTGGFAHTTCASGPTMRRSCVARGRTMPSSSRRSWDSRRGSVGCSSRSGSRPSAEPTRRRPDSVTQATSRDLPSTTGQRRAYV
jgi:hypothetical protein